MSLLDSEKDLVIDDEAIFQQVFENECDMMFPDNKPRYIRKHCTLENNAININMVITLAGSGHKEEDCTNYIFRGFSICKNISNIFWIATGLNNPLNKFDPKKHRISQINKYPMNINYINTMWVNDLSLFDYCPNININKIDMLHIYTDDIDMNTLDEHSFDFFKCVNNIDTCTFNYTSDKGDNSILKPGIIRNINADILNISMLMMGVSTNNSTKVNEEIVSNFLDELYKYNNIGSLYIYEGRTKLSPEDKVYLVMRYNDRYELVMRYNDRYELIKLISHY